MNIPTHDPQTGELNPHYEELTGKPNPMQQSIINPEIYHLISKKKKQIKYTKEFNKEIVKPNVKYMIKQRLGGYISFVKTGVRIIGYGIIPFNLTIACCVLILSEVIGIIQKMVQ